MCRTGRGAFEMNITVSERSVFRIFSCLGVLISAGCAAYLLVDIISAIHHHDRNQFRKTSGYSSDTAWGYDAILAREPAVSDLVADEDRHDETVISQLPEGPPPMTESSIDLVIHHFDIQAPAYLTRVILDPTLPDRSRTTMDWTRLGMQVHVGPSAFGSWELLQSTISKEVIVGTGHNPLIISVAQEFGIDARSLADLETYTFEWKQRRHTALTKTARLQVLREAQRSHKRYADSRLFKILPVREKITPYLRSAISG